MEQPNWWEVGQTLMRAARDYKERADRTIDPAEMAVNRTVQTVLDEIGVAICANTQKPF